MAELSAPVAHHRLCNRVKDGHFIFEQLSAFAGGDSGERFEWRKPGSVVCVARQSCR